MPTPKTGMPICCYWISVAGISNTNEVRFDSLIVNAPDVRKFPEVLSGLPQVIQKELSDRGRIYDELTIINFKVLSSAVTIPKPGKN